MTDPTLTPTEDETTGGTERLPTELMTQVVHHVANSRDHQTLGRLQRTSRDLYLLATPLLYEQLGPDLSTIVKQLGPLSLPVIENLGRLIPTSSSSHQHPIESDQMRRLYWI